MTTTTTCAVDAATTVAPKDDPDRALGHVSTVSAVGLSADPQAMPENEPVPLSDCIDELREILRARWGREDQ